MVEVSRGDDTPVIVLRINRKYRPGMDEDSLYEVTRGWWSASGARRDAAELAVAVAHGTVRGVFTIDRWEPDAGGRRCAFVGRPAQDAADFMGRDVRHLFRRGAVNPVMYAALADLVKAPRTPLGLLSEARDEVEDQLSSSGEHDTPGADSLAQIRELVESLVAEPLFHASLGSKELFHSNVLAWLCERYPDAAEAVLRPWLDRDEKQRNADVMRERRQLDLVVVKPGYRPVVFENKLFSAPDEDQLDRYAAENVPAVVAGEVTLVLLSLEDPGWSNGRHASPNGGTWVWHSYDELADALERDALPLLSGFDHDFVAAYVAVLRTLVSLLGRVTITDEESPVELPTEWKPLLKGARLWDAARKLRVRQLAKLLQQHLGDDLVVSTDFRNGEPVLTVTTRRSDVRLGWQLQGRQLRRIALFLSDGLAGRGDAAKQVRARYCTEHLSDWFNVQALLQAVTPLVTNASPMARPCSWLHFDPDFVYRYVAVSGLTVRQLFAIGAAAATDLPDVEEDRSIGSVNV